MTMGLIILGAVAAAGLLVWLYGRAQAALGRHRERQAQVEAAHEARERMDAVPPDSEQSVTDRLRDGAF